MDERTNCSEIYFIEKNGMQILEKDKNKEYDNPQQVNIYNGKVKRKIFETQKGVSPKQ
ncbi:MAG: hypothetical protein KJ779_00820 [Firmicutes bacterium]|nr:hypothetical protein [Bacillota bacterium]